MFKKFNATEDVAGRQNVKTSVQRGIKSKIVETFPKLEPYMEEIIPKKSQLSLVKWYPRLQNLGVDDLVESISRC
jgi:malignant T-cell-amplified sequence